MVIGGLWHGASWNFVIWGALHGLGLVIVRLWQGSFSMAKGVPKIFSYVSTVLTFHFVTFAWIFFRATDLDGAIAILDRIASLTVSFVNISVPIGVVLGVGLVGHYLPKRLYEEGLNLYVKAPFYAQAVALAALVFGLRYVVTTGAAPFIYNQF